jgi:hypothetical protein
VHERDVLPLLHHTGDFLISTIEHKGCWRGHARRKIRYASALYSCSVDNKECSDMSAGSDLFLK